MFCHDLRRDFCCLDLLQLRRVLAEVLAHQLGTELKWERSEAHVEYRRRHAEVEALQAETVIAAKKLEVVLTEQRSARDPSQHGVVSGGSSS